MNRFVKSNFNYFLLIGFVFCCYHFLWISPYSMKWDLSEQYLPWRHFIGKSLQNGDLPFWNPFQLGGYPTFADPQSGTWYYPSWVIGILFGYNMKVIELEIISLIIIGTLGFYSLSKKIGISYYPSLIIALCYSCNGFFVGNAQHLTWIAAAAWIPLLFYQYLFIRKDIYNYHLAWFLLVLYLFVSSSYPAFVIVCAYVIFIDQLILVFKSKFEFKFIASRILLVLLCLIILSPIIYSLIISKDYFSRGDGITLAKALQHPFSWQSLLSTIAPFSSFKNNDLFKTDISMSNAYMGLFPIICFCIYLFSKKTMKNSFWLLISLFFLVLAVGEQTPFRELLYNYLPGFNLFRFPSLFRLFFILCFLIFAGKFYDSYKEELTQKISKTVLILTGILGFFLSIIATHISSWKPFQIESLQLLSTQFDSSSFHQHLIYQLAFQSIFIILIIAALHFKHKNIFIIVIICCDLFLSVRLNAMSTIVLSTKTKDVDAIIASAPKDFQTPKLQPLITSVDQQYEWRWPLNWNMNCYYGEIASDGYNPFVLKTFNKLVDSKFKDSILQNNWFYFPEFITYSDTPLKISHNNAWVYDYSKNDTLFLNTNVEITNIRFSANGFQADYISNDSSAIVFAQNPFVGWKASIDGIEKPVKTVNIAHQLLMLDKGKHSISWKFDNKPLNRIFYINLSILIVLLGFASLKTFQLYRKSSNTNL